MQSASLVTEDGREEYVFKVLVTGESGVGKTALIKRFVSNIYVEGYKTTIGVDFSHKTLQWNENTTVRVNLWDISGQERYIALTRAYHKGAAGAIIVFDVTRYKTFEMVQNWKQEMDKKVMVRGRPVPCVLIANKCDSLHREGPVGDPVAMQRFCDENGFIAWFECSAKENTGISDAMNALIKKMLDDATDATAENSSAAGSRIVLNSADEPELKKRCC